MHFTVILRVTGILLMLFSATMLAPVPIAWWYGESTGPVFGLAFVITVTVGLALWLPMRDTRELRSRDGFMITTLFYAGLGTFGALPLYLAGGLVPSFTDAMFESISGLTTTGATVIVGLDDAPRSLLFYRQQLQWLGGMGIIVLAVAVLPMLGIGGMQLYRAESPGPIKDTKLTPRITETAKALWLIYLALTVLCGGAYWAAGMSPFDALCHAFSTVSTGGNSTHDASMAWFDNPVIESIAIVFMAIAAINFGLHFSVVRRRSPWMYLRDAEVRTYLWILGIVASLVAATLYHTIYAGEPGAAIRGALFQVVSIITTTGYTTSNFSLWPSFLPFVVLLVGMMGGCGGSTAGGIKVIRLVVLWLQGVRELRRLVHPSAVFVIKLNGAPVPDRVVDAVWGFCSVYALMLVAMTLTMMTFGLDFVSAFSAVGASLSNIGPGLGSVAANYADVATLGKWVLMVAMLLGRLEIFTLLVLLTPMYWRR